MWAELKTERSEPKIGWSGAERWAGVAENDGVERELGPVIANVSMILSSACHIHRETFWVLYGLLTH